MLGCGKTVTFNFKIVSLTRPVILPTFPAPDANMPARDHRCSYLSTKHKSQTIDNRSLKAFMVQAIFWDKILTAKITYNILPQKRTVISDIGKVEQSKYILNLTVIGHDHWLMALHYCRCFTFIHSFRNFLQNPRCPQPYPTYSMILHSQACVINICSEQDSPI